MDKKERELIIFLDKSKIREIFYVYFCLLFRGRRLRSIVFCNYMFYYLGIRIYFFIMIFFRIDFDFIKIVFKV